MKKYIMFACLSALLFSCTKGDDPEVAGKGGNGVLRVRPMHHVKQVDSVAVFIKYNSADPPVSGLYDDSVHCVRVNDTLVATFSGLKKGAYYLYGYGWDGRNLSPGQPVKGAFAYSMPDEGVHTVDLAVSE